MRAGVQYFELYCKGKYIEKEALVEEENRGFQGSTWQN
jgi:hypothetical protein